MGEARGPHGAPPPCTTVISVGELNQAMEYCPGVSLPQSQPLTVPHKPPGLLAGPCRNLSIFSSSPFLCPWPLVSGTSAQSCCGHEKLRGWSVSQLNSPRLRGLPVPPSTEVSGQLGLLLRRQQEVCEAPALPRGRQPWVGAAVQPQSRHCWGECPVRL